MTYLPPINGGRVNVTIGSNTAGVGALVSSGTMVLAGGNNITLSQNAGNAITFHGAAGGLTNINVSGSNSSSNMSAIKFSNSNGVSFGLTTGSIITASHNGITSQTNQTIGFTGATNTTMTSTGTFDARSMRINGLGAASVGFSNSSLLISAPVQTAQTQSNIQAVYDGANSISTGTIRYSNSNGVSFGINGQTLTASHNGITSQTNQTLGMFATGNTTQNSSTVLDARSLTLNGLGAVSVGYSNGSIQISGAAGGGGGGVALYDGVNNITSGTAQISGGGALTASMNGQTLSLNAPAVSSLSATGAVSISTNGSIISVGAPNFSLSAGTTSNTLNNVVFSNSNGVSFGLNGSTVTASVAAGGGGGGATVSRYIYPNEFQPLTHSAAANNSISFNYITVDQDISASQFRALFSVSANTHTSASTNTYALTAEAGIYTQNGSTISLMSNGSQTWSGTYSTNSTASVGGVRELTIPMNVAISPGEYWIGLRMSSASTNASVGYSLFQVSAQQTVHLNPGRLGAGTAGSQVLYPWHGIFSTTSAALPSTVGLTGVNGSSTFGSRAMYWFDLRNYTVL
jgi:hypothetical protein